MSVFSNVCEEYDDEISILLYKIEYLEDILNSLNVGIICDYPEILQYVWVADYKPIISDIGTYPDEYYENQLSYGYFGTVDKLTYKKCKQEGLYRKYQLQRHTHQLHRFNVPPETITVIRDKVNIGEYIIIN